MDKLKGCIIGEREIIRIFKMISFDILPVSTVRQFNEDLKKGLESGVYNFIVITETFITQINEENKISNFQIEEIFIKPKRTDIFNVKLELLWKEE